MTPTASRTVTPTRTPTNSPVFTNTPVPVNTPTPTPTVNPLTPDGVFGANHNVFTAGSQSVLFYYNVPQPAHVQLLVYNVLGLRVRQLVDEDRAAGVGSVLWDGRNDQGSLVSTDLYFIVVHIGKTTYVRKEAVVRSR